MDITPTPNKPLVDGDVCRLRNSPILAPTPDGMGGEHLLWSQLRTMRVSYTLASQDSVTCEWLAPDGLTFTKHEYPRSALYHVSFFEERLQGKSAWWISDEDGEWRTYDSPDWTLEQIAIANGRLAQIAAAMQMVAPPAADQGSELPLSLQPDTLHLPTNL